MSDKKYDFLKRVGRYVLPALATCVTTIFEIWNLPYGPQVGATIMAIDTALNVILGISSKNYYKEKKQV